MTGRDDQALRAGCKPIGDNLGKALALGRWRSGVKLFALIDVEQKTRRRDQRKLVAKVIVGRLDQVGKACCAAAKPFGPFASSVDAPWIGRVGKPQRNELQRQRVDRVFAGLHCQIGIGAAMRQRLGPGTLSAGPALAFERTNYASLYQARLADPGIADERNQPTGRGGDLVENFGSLAIAAKEEIGVLLLQGHKTAIGVDGAPGFGRLGGLARLKRGHDLRQRIGRCWLRALDPMELRQARQVGGLSLGAVRDNHWQEDEAIIVRLAIAGFVILQPLPVAHAVGYQDHEGLCFRDRLRQSGLPKMPVAQMCLVDKHIGAWQRSLDCRLQAERDATVWRLKAQEDAH